MKAAKQLDWLCYSRDILCVLLLCLLGCQGGGSQEERTGVTPSGMARIRIQIGSATAAQRGTIGSTTGAQRQRLSALPPEVTSLSVRILRNGQDIPGSPLGIDLETGSISVLIDAAVEYLLSVDARNQRGESIFHGEATVNIPAGTEAVVPITLAAREVLRLVATQFVAALTGGEVVVSDPQSALRGLRLLIPAGALAQDTTFTITEVTNPRNVPALLSQAGSIVDLLPDGLLFAVPATLTFPYDPTLVSALGFDAPSLRVWRYNAPAGQWAPVSEQVVDLTTNVIQAQLTALSFYTVAEAPPGSVNQPPVADVQFVTTLEDTSQELLLTGSDADGEALTFRVISGPSLGTLNGVPPALLYTPRHDVHGRDTFTFVAHDGQRDSAPASVSIDITAVNDSPVLVRPLDNVLVDDTTVNASTTRELSTVVTDVDSLTNADTLRFTVSNNTQPELVLATIEATTLTLTHASRTSRRNGSAVITVRATDQGGSFVETSFTVTVQRTYPFLIGESRLGDTTRRLTRPAN
ncbi:MAG: Ig-like domain-containing protein [Candidatus Tectimicrobiota bacterium]